MARGYSRVILVGNLGADPDMKYLQSGDAVTNFSLAVNRRRRGSDGNQVDETDWYRVACYRRNAEIASEYLRKGARVLVDGQLSIREYTDKDGQKRTSVEVNCDLFQMLGDKRDDAAGDTTADVPF